MGFGGVEEAAACGHILRAGASSGGGPEPLDEPVRHGEAIGLVRPLEKDSFGGGGSGGGGCGVQGIGGVGL